MLLELHGAIASWILDGGLARQLDLILDTLKITLVPLRHFNFRPSYKIVNMPLPLFKSTWHKVPLSPQGTTHPSLMTVCRYSSRLSRLQIQNVF